MEFGDHQEAAHLQGGDGERIESMVPSYDSLNNSAFTRLPKLPVSPVALDVEPTSQRKPRYRECLKNHAVNIGAQAVDGCCEFMPAGPDGTIDALKCAACTCHRNFHRKETYPTVIHGGSVGGGGGGGGGGVISLDPYQIHLQNPAHPQPLLTHYPHPFPPPAYYGRAMASSATASPTGYLQAAGVGGGSGGGVAPPPGMQQRPLALPANSGGGGSGGGGEEGGMTSGGEGSNSKKRFRTKFTAAQKQRMVEFADSVNWRLQRSDDETVQRFCNDIGLKRHVLKVWMHNNKHTIGMGKQQEEVKKEE